MLTQLRHNKTQQEGEMQKRDVHTLIEPLNPHEQGKTVNKVNVILGTLRIEGRNEVESDLVTA